MVKEIAALAACLACCVVQAQTSLAPESVSEQDFLGDMPMVLSVSRLAQRIDDTPGAVSILDRQFIRMSGARDVVDLLRLVPGFQSTTTFEADAPMATYHGRNDDWANRIQVLVDGRSVYSGHLGGSAGLGWQTLALDDIDRIEVLRGSNSAAYGSRAFLGVVNIISRDVYSTKGYSASVTGGENAVIDVGARVGWGDIDNAYRLSLDTRGDDGLRGAFGKNRIDRVNFSASFAQRDGAALEIRAGALEIEAGRGTPGSAGNNARIRSTGSRFVQADWRTPLGEDQDLAVSASHTQITHRDSFPYLDASLDSSDLGVQITYVGIPIDFGGKEFNDALSFQHTVRHSPELRTVWGGELRREQVISKPLFDQRERVTSNFVRLFGNAEWRVLPQWVLNAGALLEHSDIGGDSVSPRIMLNWHAAEGQTLRGGVSSAFRPPSAFEKYAAVRYYDVNGANPITTVENFGLARPEKILAQELGYNWSALKGSFTGDVRVFNEAITDGISATANQIGRMHLNGDQYTIRGIEYELLWKPAVSTRIFFNQAWTRINVDSLVDLTAEFRTVHGAPELTSSLTVLHHFDNGLNMTVSHQRTENTALMSDANRNQLFSMGRTDLRFAKDMQFAGTKAELALTLQNLEQPYRDGDWKYFFDQRALITIRFEN